MPLSRIQKRRIYHVLATGKRKRASREQLLASIVTHRTETNYGNPAGGHGTSSGWRQQISGAGVKSRNRQSIRKQAGYFFDEARGKRGTPGQISNAVQRSAYPQKASDPSINREAEKILAAFEAGRLGRVPGGGGRPGGGSREVTRTVTPGVDNSGVRRDAKLAYLSQRGSPDALLNLAASLRGAGDVPAVTKTSVVRTPGRRVRPKGAVRDGGGYAGTEKVAQSATRGFAVSSAKRARQMTASGNTSDHYVGNKRAYAHDLPAVGAQGDRIFRRVARRFGINAKPGSYQRHMVKIGGRRYSVQLLWKVEGHHDHVHVGVKRV